MPKSISGQTRYPAPKGRTGHGVDVVERHHTVVPESITFIERELREEAADGGGDLSDHDAVNAVGNQVTSEDEHRSVAAAAGFGEPNFAPLHGRNVLSQLVPGASSNHVPLGWLTASVSVTDNRS